MKALFTIVPTSAIPGHALQLIDDLLADSNESASQLGCTSDLLASIIVATMVRFVETGEVVDGWRIDLLPIAENWKTRLARVLPEIALRRRVNRRLRLTP